MALNDDEEWVDVNSDWVGNIDSSKVEETEELNSSNNNCNLEKEFVFCEKASNNYTRATLTIAIASTDTVAVNTSSTIAKEELQPPSPHTSSTKVYPPEIRVPSVTVVSSSPKGNNNKRIEPKDKCQALEAAMSRATENLAESLNRAFTDLVGDADITPPYSGKFVQAKFAY